MTHPQWLTPEAARIIAQAAGAVLARRGSPEEAKAAARAVAVACLPALPAPMLAEAVAAVAPTEAPPPDRIAVDLVPADADTVARRLSLLARGADTEQAAAKLGARLATAGAAWVKGRAR